MRVAGALENLHLRVIAVVLCFHLPASVETKSRWIHPDAQHGSGCWWAGELCLNCSLTGVSALPEDIPQTAVTADLSYNTIKAFLCPEGGKGEWMLKHLNLSHNLISELALTTCRSFPGLETLNLNDNAIHTLTLGIPTPGHEPNKHGKVDCLLPALKVLSVEGNKLSRVPRGLGLLQSLQTVHLTSNGIRHIELNDFQNCSQLKHIDLRKNKITAVHLDAFRDLHKLQVVDLRDNALATPLPQIFITLNFFQLEVDLSGNAWIFSCKLNAFKQLLHSLFDSTRQKLSIAYTKSATNSQKPLLHLSSFQLNCSQGVLLKRVAIPVGQTAVLNCALDNTRGKGVSWWTPKGRISKDNHLPDMTLGNRSQLVIHKAEKAAAGLYLCAVNTSQEKSLLYSVKVEERLSAPLLRRARDTNAALGRSSTEQDLALAVCLSVFITFVCAFCLGAFARPYLVSLWRFLRRNQSSASEHTYSNQAFSDETWSRELSASKATSTGHNLLIPEETSSREMHTFPTEAAALYENVTGSSVHAPNSAAEYQKQSTHGLSAKEESVAADLTSSQGGNTNVDANRLLSLRTGYQNFPEVETPRKSTSEDISLWNDSKHAINEASEKSRLPPPARRLSAGTNHTDSSDSHLPFTAETDFPSSTTQAPHSMMSKASHSSGLLQPEITKAMGNLSVSQTAANSPLPGSDCKTEGTQEKGASAAVFGDSSSDEGTPFTMSDCSSLSDFKLDHPDGSANLPAHQLAAEEANTSSGSEKLSALPAPPNMAVELQGAGENEAENDPYFESTTPSGPGPITPGTASPDTAKCDEHLSMAGSDTAASTPQPPAGFPKAESPAQNSDPLCNQSTDFRHLLLSLKYYPTLEADAEDTPQEAESQLYHFPGESQHSPSSSPTAQTESAPEGSRDKHTGQNSSEQNHEGAVRWGSKARMSEDSDFSLAPIGDGLNGFAEETSVLPFSSQAPLQPLPQHAAGNHFTLTTEDFLGQGEQVNTAQACADHMERGFGENTCGGCTELEESSSCRPPQETQQRSLTTDLLLLDSSMEAESSISTEDHLQGDQSDEDEHSFSVPQGSFSRSTQYSSWPLPQETRGALTSEGSDSSKLQDNAALTGLENNSTAAVNLQCASEKLPGESQADSGQRQFFVKKRRAFDGFAKVLQSSRADSNSWDSNV